MVLHLPGAVYAQETDIQFEHITVDQGLSQSSGLCILQDAQGFMWFGTQTGLNRYDGYKFTVYKYDKLDLHSLSDNWISAIYEDQFGILWVGTDGGGLNKFNRETEQFTGYIYEPDNPNSLGANRVLSIYEDQFGTLWVGTDGGGLNKFNRETEQFTRYTNNSNDPDSLSNDSVSSIYEDQSGTLWLGTRGGGVNKFDRETDKFSHYQHNPNDSNSLSNDQVLSIYEDHSGLLWIGTNGGGLNKFERETGQFTHYKHDPKNPNSLSHDTVSSIVEDRFGNLWLGTSSWYGNSYGTALDKFDPKKGQFIHYTHDPINPNSLNDNTVPYVYKDNSEILWIGTGFGGINKLDTKDKKFKHYKSDPDNPNSLASNHIFSIYEDQSGIIWIGTEGGGLNKFDRKTEKFTNYKHDPANPNSLSGSTIWSVYEDRSGMLWIGSQEEGLNKFNRQTGKFTHYKNNPDNLNSLSDDTVTSIYEDHLGTFWIGTFKGGLNKLDRQTGKFTHYQNDPNDPNSLSDNTVWSIYEDKSGTLWIGGYGKGGLNKFNRETGKFTRYKHDPNNPNSLSYDRITSIYEYPTGTLWIGTQGGGLNKFNKSTEQFANYTEKNGLPNNSVIGILGDNQGNLWLSTEKGLSKFNPQTEKFRNYDVSDGLQGTEFDGVKAYFKSETGEMFFGGYNGFNAFYPQQVKDNPHIPPIVITDFKIFEKDVNLDKSISETQEIQLSHKDDFFSFQFSALDYTNPDKNQYAYKLEGFDKGWIYSGTRRYASYTNLDGGTYVFRVKGSNNDGVWNEEGTSLKIIIAPPPWKTWWAYILYVLTLVCAVCGYVHWRTEAQARENALLRESERELQQILEAIPVGILVIDTERELTYANQSALQLIGKELTPHVYLDEQPEFYQIYTTGTDQLYPTEDLPLGRALKGEKTHTEDIEIHQPGKIIPLEVWGTPIYDEQGNIIYGISAFQDITPRKQAEAERQQFIAALQQARNQLQAVLDTVPGCVSWMSANGQYIGANQYLANILNLSTDEFPGKDIGFLNQDSEFAKFMLQFLVSSEVHASQVIDIPIAGVHRSYLVAVQKYQGDTAAVSVGIDITEQKQAEAELSASLREKEILLQEVHHRVKNNLQIICSLLDLQSYKLNDQGTIAVFRESYNRVQSMALIHEKLYQSTSLEKIDLAEYVETLTDYLRQCYGTRSECITVKVNVEPIFLNLTSAIPLGLIINELVSNALKYAFPAQKNGLIEVNLKSEREQKFILNIQDNGIGLPENVDWRKNTTTLGLQLVQVLTEQLDGEITLDQSQGTNFQIKFFEAET
ncbi:two-component regulator propeller domain-containing protein [Lyngbya aestuarii]|uniref:two-component regulator propeller domain-containing protein n=1 Tax=Lyngbya aestuarii TaxID=118322 RepID=UPI00403E0895